MTPPDDRKGFEDLLDEVAPGFGALNSDDEFDPRTSTLRVRIRAKGRKTDDGRLADLTSTRSIAEARQAPTDLVAERLAWVTSQVSIAMLVAFTTLRLLFPPGRMDGLRPDPQHLIGLPVRDLLVVAMVGASIIVFLLARANRIKGFLAQDIGLIYYVLIAAGIQLWEHWEPWPTHYIPPFISWSCLWITLYPMVVPATRGKLGIAAISAGLSSVIMFGATVLIRGNPVPDVPVLIWIFVPPLLASALALYPATWIHKIDKVIEEVRELGAYHLQEMIGQGGMGEVWTATHRLLARPAAIKLIRTDGLNLKNNETALARFEREARITAALHSPHTVRLYDFGRTEDGAFYYVMELLDGIDLERLVHRYGPLPPARVVHLLHQACHSLAEAHAAGLVHRDIKPANMVTCRSGLEYDYLKILDFGLVRAIAQDNEDNVRLTAAGVAAGTPAYIAPEIARGHGGAPKSDLYALGCVGYWLLTGTLVFEGNSPMSLMLKHIEETPASPSTRTSQEIAPKLESLILECLAKDPARRPASAAVMRTRLASIATDNPWTAKEAKAWWEEVGPNPPVQAANPAQVHPDIDADEFSVDFN